MTKDDFLKSFDPHDASWITYHKKYIADALNELDKVFDTKRFVADYSKGNEYVTNILECFLADAYEDNNYELGELENHISRMLCVSPEDVVKYRTEKFWSDIANC